ncbi:hypothetical protein J4Q44_G00247630 [Coregonus suidteri]|uniref:C2H2-type domain-containing protein n=1 Tax=Coregonus suidteri TaxID=861788 RepID=A0AAN8QWM8_9TELE
MADSDVEQEPDWSNPPSNTAEDTLVAMECLLTTLRALEATLRQQDISEISSTEYCDNFCQTLMHYAGSRNSVEHGLPLLEVYCLSINCFAAARPHLTADSDNVALVLKRLALSCFELLLSVPENEIPYEAWVQFYRSVQVAHDALLEYGSTDLAALLQITGEGGAWSNPVLSALLTGQPTNTEEVEAYIALEGEGFMEMRVKHLEKVGEVAKAVVLAKSCAECNLVSNQTTFRQTYVALLCHLLPGEEAIMEISRLDCKDVLDITCSLETEGEENTAFILCTTFLTQQLQQQSLYCSWELTLLWSKLQRRIDPSLESLLERCLQLGAIAKTVYHLLFLVHVIRTEAEELGLASSVELCVKALQLPNKEDTETRISVCKTVACLLADDLEVLRACQLTEFLLGLSLVAFSSLEELSLRTDQKYDQENATIPNSLRCELLLALKAHWPFDPEFWDWKTLKHQCIRLLGLEPEPEQDEEAEEEGGQEEVYHHEAQHFRDAAYSCASLECKKFYFSKKEFSRHLASHGITFSQEDFEAQRKAIRKHLDSITEDIASPKKYCETKTVLEEVVNGGNNATSSTCRASSSHVSSCKEPKGTMTLVAVCFDGKKFTCGFERCGLTFSKARDVHKHLRGFHPEHFKAENKERKNLDKEEGLESKGLKVKTEQDNDDKNKHEHAACLLMKGSSQGIACPSLIKNNTTSTSCLANDNDPLREILIGLSQLSLTPSNSTNGYCEPSHPMSESTTSKISCNQGLGTMSPVVLLQKRAPPAVGERMKLTSTPEPSVAHGLPSEQHLESTKPYFCDLNGCNFRCVMSTTLRRHYMNKHHFSEEKVKGMKILKSLTFKPFKCHLCFKCHREKTDLRVHYLQTHRLSEAVVEKMSWSKKWVEGKPPEPTKPTVSLIHKSQTLTWQHPSWQQKYQKKKVMWRRHVEGHPSVLSEDPALQKFRCSYANCNASYLLNSSLVRHLESEHPYQVKSSLKHHRKSNHPYQAAVCCKYDGCTQVFTQSSSLKKHVLSSHLNYYDSLVLRLQNTHNDTSVTGCQKKLIFTSSTLQKDATKLPLRQSLRHCPKSPEDVKAEETSEEHDEDDGEMLNVDQSIVESKSKHKFEDMVFRSHEEALQMCQDRCQREAYPCMVQGCDSVVKLIRSMRRHYLNCHKLTNQAFELNENKLVFSAEQLEELIQRNTVLSAWPDMTRAPNGVLKMEYQAEPENPGGPSVPMSLHSIKAETLDDHDPLGFKEEPPAERNVLVGADDLLYGEPTGHTEDPATQNSHSQEARPRRKSSNPPALDLSPPSSLRFSVDEGFMDSSGKPTNIVSLSSPQARQPLKRKNALSDHPPISKDPQPQIPPPHTFDLATYKPMGFESSFLKFIQENSKDKDAERPQASHCNNHRPDPTVVSARQRDSYRHSCSVKENSQVGLTTTHSRRAQSSPLKTLPRTGDTSVQNLRVILDKALTGCGDLAIKQLHHLRPVVVLERPRFSTSLLDLFPTKMNDKLILEGS